METLMLERHTTWKFTRSCKNEVSRAIENRDADALIWLTRCYLEARGAKKNLASPHTHRLYAVGVRKLLTWAWGDRGVHLLKITEDDLDDFVNALAAEPEPLPAPLEQLPEGAKKPRSTRLTQLSRSSMDVYLAGVRTFFKALVWSNAIGTDPSLTLRAARSERNPKRPSLDRKQMLELRALPTRLLPEGNPSPAGEKLELLRQHLDLRDTALIEVAYGGQLRAAELCALDLTDLNLSGLSLTVTGKGKKRRVVTLNKAAVEALRAWLGVRKALATPVSAGAVFISGSKRNRGSRISYATVYALVKSRLAGLERALGAASLLEGGQAVSLGGVHTLRRSGATALYELSKNDLRSLQIQLGHADISTTANYVSPSSEVLRLALDQLE